MPLDSKFGDATKMSVAKKRYVPKDLARAAAKSKEQQRKVESPKPKKEKKKEPWYSKWGVVHSKEELKAKRKEVDAMDKIDYRIKGKYNKSEVARRTKRGGRGL